MPTLSPAQMLKIWEDGQSTTPWRRALMLLEVAEPDLSPSDLARLPLGERDAQAVFGTGLSSLARCPECGEDLELSFTVDDVRMPPPEGRGPWIFEDGPLRVAFDLPDSLGFEALVPAPGASEALLGACIRDLSIDDAPATLGDLTPAQRGALSERIAETDPRADMKAAMVCPLCEHAWSAQFDIVAFFWEEIGAWVRRILAEVHVLARAYGWRESDVLELSAWRRRQYLALERS